MLHFIISCMHCHHSGIEQLLSVSRQRRREFVVMEPAAMLCTCDQFRLVWSLACHILETFFFLFLLFFSALTGVGQQVRELVKKINGLEEQRDALERRLATQVQPATTAGACESSPAGTGGLPLQDQLLLKVSHRVTNPFLPSNTFPPTPCLQHLPCGRSTNSVSSDLDRMLKWWRRDLNAARQKPRHSVHSSGLMTSWRSSQLLRCFQCLSTCISFCCISILSYPSSLTPSQIPTE